MDEWSTRSFIRSICLKLHKVISIAYLIYISMKLLELAARLIFGMSYTPIIYTESSIFELGMSIIRSVMILVLAVVGIKLLMHLDNILQMEDEND